MTVLVAVGSLAVSIWRVWRDRPRVVSPWMGSVTYFVMAWMAFSLPASATRDLVAKAIIAVAAAGLIVITFVGRNRVNIDA
ncbi:MAG TPA: hypothetical protein VG323_15375 [Thermoanaerobaculia bacterium]|nr:hypothetical protein [Thermoanaerobaculia bacterium]